MGNESYFKWTKAACNSKKNVSLNHFLGHFMAYNSDCAQVETIIFFALANVNNSALAQNYWRGRRHAVPGRRT